MPKFDDLKAVATERPLQGSDPQIVLYLTDSLEVEWNSDDVAHALCRFFEEDDRRSAVQLSISGQMIGYLNRQSFLEAATQTKLGEGQLPEVPGVSTAYSFLRLKCPFPGCAAPLVLKAYYDHRNPPKCPIHSEVALEVA